MIPYIDRKYFLLSVPSSDVKKETDNDINVRCPICGDSKKNQNKARGHLYIKNGMEKPVYHCFNCEFSGNMFKYLKEVDLSLYESYVKELRNESLLNLKKKTKFTDAKSYTDYTDDKIPDIKYKITLDKPKELFDIPSAFVKASESSIATAYLRSRCLNPEDFYYSEDNIKIGDKFIQTKQSIIIPLWYKDKIYGFQARSTTQKYFYTYIPEENQGFKIWNYFSIDKSKPTFVFESVFDALSSGLPKNTIISALGVDINEKRKKKLKIIYCLDNQHLDETSYKKSIKLLQNGERVFIWPKDIPYKDANEWLCKEQNKKEIASTILTNVYSGIKGILKLKLK